MSKKKKEKLCKINDSEKVIMVVDADSVPSEIVPIAVDERIYAATPSIPSLTDAIQKCHHQMVENTRGVFNNGASDEAMANADKNFISALIAETCCTPNHSLDETLMRAVVKSQLYDDTLNKMKNADPDQLNDDVIEILNLSFEYIHARGDKIASGYFHNRLSEVLQKYNPEVIDKLNKVKLHPSELLKGLESK